MSLSPIVLVHGGLHRAWCWERLLPFLDDVEVHIADLRSSGTEVAELEDLHADAAAVRTILDELRRPCVLVGHSYGGAVITYASAGHPNVAHLVYLAAFMPAAGQSILDTFQPPADWLRPTSDGLALELTDPRNAPEIFYNCCDPATALWASSRLEPYISAAACVTPVSAAGWETVPSTYVVSTRDQALAPDTQRAMAKQATSTTEVAADHSAFLCQPETIASILRAAAELHVG